MIPPTDDPMVNPTQELAEAVAALAASNDTLTAKANEITKRLQGKAEQTAVKKTFRVALGAYGLWILEFLTVVTFGSIILTQQGQIEHQQHNTCVLYSFVISSYNERSRALSPLGPAQYDDFYRRIQDVADDNGCAIPHKVK